MSFDFTLYNFKVSKLRKTGQRKGQAMFNALYEMRPDLAEVIVGDDIDPFYEDKKCDVFMEWLNKQVK